MTDRLARMLAHPLRDRVLFEYQCGEASPSEVAQRLGRPINLIAYHTRVLFEHGCVELARTERRHGALTRFYRSATASVIDDDAWMRVPDPLRRALTLGTLRAVGEGMRAAALTGAFDSQTAHMTRSLLVLDDEGVIAVSRVLHDAFEHLSLISEQARARAQSPERLYEVAILACDAVAAAQP